MSSSPHPNYQVINRQIKSDSRQPSIVCTSAALGSDVTPTTQSLLIKLVIGVSVIISGFTCSACVHEISFHQQGDSKSERSQNAAPRISREPLNTPATDFSSNPSLSDRLSPDRSSSALSDNTAQINSPDREQIQPLDNNKDLEGLGGYQLTFETTSLPSSVPNGVEIITITGCRQGAKEQFLSLNRQGRVAVWDLASDRGYELLGLEFTPRIAQFSFNCRYLAAVQGSLVQVIDLVSRKTVAVLSRVRARTTALRWAPGGEEVYLGTSDGAVYLWKFLKPEGALHKPNLERYSGHSSVVSALVPFPKGRVFFSADWNGTLSAWLRFDADAQKGRYDVNIFGEDFFSELVKRQNATRSADSRTIQHLVANESFVVAATQDGTLELWDDRGFRLAHTQSAHRGLIYALAISPSGRLIASAGRDGQINIFSIETTSGGSSALAAAPRSSVLTLLQTVELADIRALSFIDDRRLFAGTAAGGVAEVSVTINTR